ncbi:hypothetical protein LTR74_016865 [Friedmanniomyces endolithicus]|nr:hypothetical protein LTR74_016865 [Friedmanniomyces endolithicus]
MLMFFVRTQRPHDWHSPVYRFNRRQKTAFEAMIQAVSKEARHSGDEAESEEEESEDEGSRGSEDNDGPSHQPDTSPGNEAPSPELRAVHRAFLAFCIELMNQTIHNQEYDMAMVCATAVLGVHAQHGFRDPESYPPILSSIIKVARFMIIQKAEEIAQPTEGDKQYSPCARAMHFEPDADSGYDSEEQSPVRRPRGHTQHPRSQGSIVPATTSFGWVQQMVRTFMARGTAGPIQWMLDLRTYGLKTHYNTIAIGHVNWKDKHTLKYKNIASTMDKFRGMVHQLVADSRRAFASEGGYHRERVWDWMRQVARFRGLLLVLMHITGGQPARGTEILSCRHRNTAAGSHRNVFIENGQIVFVTKYHRGVEITGDVKIIHGYLPREVGE